MIAFAANETTGETDVFVTFSGFGNGDEPNETGPTREEPDVRGYEINIPASYSTNEAPFMAITANFVSVGVGKRVTVSIDGAKTFINGEPFTLTNMADPSRKVICGLYRSIGEWMPPPDDAVVAIFENVNTAPVSYGNEALPY